MNAAAFCWGSSNFRLSDCTTNERMNGNVMISCDFNEFTFVHQWGREEPAFSLFSTVIFVRHSLYLWGDLSRPHMCDEMCDRGRWGAEFTLRGSQLPVCITLPVSRCGRARPRSRRRHISVLGYPISENLKFHCLVWAICIKTNNNHIYWETLTYIIIIMFVHWYWNIRQVHKGDVFPKVHSNSILRRNFIRNLITRQFICIFNLMKFD